MERDSENEERHMPCEIPGRLDYQAQKILCKKKIHPAEFSSDYRAIGSYCAKPFPLGGGEQLVNKLLATETHNLF